MNGTRSVVRYIYLKKENKFKFNFIASLWVPRALTIDLIWKCLYVGYAYIFNKAFFLVVMILFTRCVLYVKIDPIHTPMHIT